jgi:uncharacterized protein (DUF58 family)
VRGVLRPFRRALRVVTPFGWGLVLLAASGGVVAALTGWVEFLVLCVTAAVVLGLGLLFVVVPSPSAVDLRVVPDRVTVGDSVRVELTMRPRAIPVLHPEVEVLVGQRQRAVRFGIVTPASWHRRATGYDGGREHLDLKADRRGVHLMGPVTRIRSDPPGCFRRRRSWPEVVELYVRPEVAMLDQLDAGRISDLDGVVSDRPAPSDLAFHTLREYVPGDDLRHVHWRSSAKADQLLVRQFVETRRSQATVVVDDGAAAYATEDDFELAVSVAASVALRAVQDQSEVSLACGNHRIRSDDVDTLLDETCRFDTGGHDLVGTTLQAGSGGANLAVLITGGRRADAEVLAAVAQFSAQALRVVVRADQSEPSGMLDADGVRILSVRRLSELPALLAGASR